MNSAIKTKVIEYLKKNPAPKDDKEFHKFAETVAKEHGIAEEAAYEILGDFLTEGRSKGKKDNVDPKELAMGIKVESEHVSNKVMQEKIARDHLKEIPDYYSRLAKMEKEADKPMKKAYINVYDNIYIKMNKAKGTHKYIDRKPHPSGKGFIYFYNQKQIKDYKEKGTIPGKKEEKSGGILSGIMSFFGFKDSKQAKEKVSSIYNENQSKLKGVSEPVFADYMNEYLSNKDKWDTKLKPKEKKESGPKEEKEKKPDTEKPKSEKKVGKSWNMSLMRTVAGIVGGGKDLKQSVDENKEKAEGLKNKKDLPKVKFKGDEDKYAYFEVDSWKENGKEYVRIVSDDKIDQFNKSDVSQQDDYSEVVEKSEMESAGGGSEKKEKREPTTSSQLMDLDNMAMDSIKADSGGEIRNDPKKAKQYADAIFKELDKKGVKQLAIILSDKLEDENYHLLNQVLELGGYFGKEKQDSAIKFNDEQIKSDGYYSFPKEAFSKDNFETMPEGEDSASKPAEGEKKGIFSDMSPSVKPSSNSEAKEKNDKRVKDLFKDKKTDDMRKRVLELDDKEIMDEISDKESKELEDLKSELYNREGSIYGSDKGDKSAVMKEKDGNEAKDEKHAKKDNKSSQEKYDDAKKTIASFEDEHVKDDYTDAEWQDYLEEIEDEWKLEIKDADAEDKKSKYYKEAKDGLENLKKYKNSSKNLSKLKNKVMKDEGQGAMFKASQLLLSELRKAKKMPIGTINKDGLKKVAEGKWVKPTQDRPEPKAVPKKGEGKPADPKKDEKKAENPKKEEMKQRLRDTLKKVATILSDALSGKDTVAPTGQAVEQAGEQISPKKKQEPKKKVKPTEEKPQENPKKKVK